jgi:NADH-ubiquinone oxidoreductase chain 6
MMINIKLADILDVGSQYTKNFPLALTVGSLFIYEIFTIIPFSYNNVSILNLPIDLLNYLNGLFFSSKVSSISEVNVTHNPYTADTIFSDFLQIESLGLSAAVSTCPSGRYVEIEQVFYFSRGNN